MHEVYKLKICCHKVLLYSNYLQERQYHGALLSFKTFFSTRSNIVNVISIAAVRILNHLASITWQSTDTIYSNTLPAKNRVFLLRIHPDNVPPLYTGMLCLKDLPVFLHHVAEVIHLLRCCNCSS